MVCWVRPLRFLAGLCSHSPLPILHVWTPVSASALSTFLGLWRHLAGLSGHHIGPIRHFRVFGLQQLLGQPLPYKLACLDLLSLIFQFFLTFFLRAIVHIWIRSSSLSLLALSAFRLVSSYRVLLALFMKLSAFSKADLTSRFPFSSQHFLHSAIIPLSASWATCSCSVQSSVEAPPWLPSPQTRSLGLCLLSGLWLQLLDAPAAEHWHLCPWRGGYAQPWEVLPWLYWPSPSAS